MKTTKVLTITTALTVGAQAQLIRIAAGDFTPEASSITFSEQALGTTNPVFNVPTASLGTVGVAFGGIFQGQTTSGSGVVTLADSNPSGPLALDLSGPAARIVGDGANPTSPVLSGSPTFNGPIAVLFSTPVAAVGLDGGFFDAVGGTSIEAYDAGGNSLGIVTNEQIGIEFFGLADASGTNAISGISFYVTGNEPAGFAIDNLTFGSVDEVEIINGPTEIPEPNSALVLLGLFGMALGGRRRK